VSYAGIREKKNSSFSTITFTSFNLSEWTAARKLSRKIVEDVVGDLPAKLLVCGRLGTGSRAAKAFGN
jgi:hypothetical protein